MSEANGSGDKPDVPYVYWQGRKEPVNAGINDLWNDGKTWRRLTELGWIITDENGNPLTT